MSGNHRSFAERTTIDQDGEAAGTEVAPFGGSTCSGGAGEDRNQKNMMHAIVPRRQPIRAETIDILRLRSLAISEI